MSPSSPAYISSSQRCSTSRRFRCGYAKSTESPCLSCSISLNSARSTGTSPAACSLLPYNVLDDSHNCTARILFGFSGSVEKNEAMLNQKLNKTSLLQQSICIPSRMESLLLLHSMQVWEIKPACHSVRDGFGTLCSFIAEYTFPAGFSTVLHY